MTTVTSLTKTRIEELMSGWVGVAASQEEIDALIDILNTMVQAQVAAMTELSEVTLPNLETDLAANNTAVLDLTTNVLPGLDSSIAQNTLDIENLNTAILPILTEELASANNWIIELNDVTLPALYTQLGDNNDLITEFNTVTLPALNASLASNAGAINTLNTVTLPALNTSLTNAQNDVDAVEARFPITGPDIAANAIAANHISAGSITAVKILAGTITANEIAANTITANKIAADTITANEIAANAITASEINAGAITAVKIAADTITAAQIAAGAITASELAAGSVIAGKIAAGTIVAADIAADTITAAQIAAGAITASEIATGAITAGKIAAGTIVAADIATDAITAIKIKAGEITAAKIAADTITANEIATGAITATEIATGAITASKIDVNALNGKLITGSTLQTAASGTRVWIGTISGGSSIPTYGQVSFYSGGPYEDPANPSGLHAYYDTSSQRTMGVYLSGPNVTDPAHPGSVLLGFAAALALESKIETPGSVNVMKSYATLSGSTVYVVGDDVLELKAPIVRIGQSGQAISLNGDMIGAGGNALFNTNGSGLVGPFAWDASGIPTGIGKSFESWCTTNTSPTSTAVVTVTGVSASFTVGNTNEVWEIAMMADCSLTTAGSRNVTQLLLDGVAVPRGLVFGAFGTLAGVQLPGSRIYRLTGLSVGSHTLTMNTRSNAAASTTTLNAFNTGLVGTRVA